jgi:hypothetical protein
MGTGLKLGQGKLVATARGGLAVQSGAALIRARVSRLLRARRGELESHPDWGNPAFEERSAPTTLSRAELRTEDVREAVEADPGVSAVTVFELRRLGERTWHLRLAYDTDEYGAQEQEVTF